MAIELNNNIVNTDSSEGSGGGGGATILTFENKEVSVWLSDSTYTGYGYKAEITCAGVTSSMVANVIFAPTEADSGNYATVCDTDTNTVTIYSKVNTTITIPTIVAMEG